MSGSIYYIRAAREACDCSDSAFAHISVVEESDTQVKEDQSGALDATSVAHFLVDTSVPTRLSKSTEYVGKAIAAYVH